MKKKKVKSKSSKGTQNPLRKKTINFRGQTITYQSQPQLAQRLNLTLNETKKLLSDIRTKKTLRYITENGLLGKYDIRSRPLLYRALGRNTRTNLSNKEFFNAPKNLNNSSNVKMIISIKFKFIVSSETFEEKDSQTKEFNVDMSPDNINQNFLEDLVYNEYLKDEFARDEVQILIINHNIISKFTNQKFKLINNKLRRSNPLNIDNVFNEVLYYNTNGNCIYEYLNYIHPKISQKSKSNLETLQDIKNYATKYNIKMLCYDINGDIITSHYPIKKNTSYKNIIFVSYDNHLYPIKNSVLNKVRNKSKLNIIVVDDSQKLFIEYIKKGILPSNIFYKNSEIYSFRVDEVIYTSNDEYNISKNILSKYGLLDKLRHYTTLKNIGSIIETLYLKENINSFWPHSNRFIRGGFNYKQSLNKEYDEHKILCLDKNKAYSFSAAELPFLIKVDIKINKRFYNVKTITDHYLYIVTPEKSNIILPDENIYLGLYLKHAKNLGINFKIKEGIETQKMPNYLKEMINDLYKKVDNNTFKKIMNVYLGKFNMSNRTNKYFKVNKILNEEEKDFYEGFFQKLDNNIYAKIETKENINIFNRKPIDIMIKDFSRLEIYKTMEKLKLDDTQILQVKTDSITYIKKNDDYKKLISKDLKGWKTENYKPIKNSSVRINDYSFKYFSDNQNILYDCLAGCGKTYTILNNIIKNLDNYIILTPSYETLKPFKNLNSFVIAKFSLTDKIPKEHNIIIDEIGMINSNDWNFLFKCKEFNKKIIGLGDFHQLPPPEKEKNNVYNNPLYIDYIFNKKIKLEKNYRNNFSKEYYQSLYLSNNKTYLLNEIEKYNTNYKDAEVTIAYRNKIRHQYNNLILEHKNFNCRVNKDNGTIEGPLEKDLEIILINNELDKYNIYNKEVFKIKEIKKNKIFIKNNDKEIILNKTEIFKNFNIAYCRTLYAVQGHAFKSFHYPKEDYKFLSGRAVYTLISRLTV